MPADVRRPCPLFQQAPCSALRPFVRHFRVVTHTVYRNDAHLPDTGPVAAFTFQGRCQLGSGEWVPEAAFTGLSQQVRTHAHRERHSVVLATFTPIGAQAFLSPPLEAFSDQTTNLVGVLGHRSELADLAERLTEAPDHSRRIRLVEAHLLARLRMPAPDPLVAAAVDWLEHDAEPRRIAALARYIGLSQSAIERRFRRVVGLSPKRFASIVRLQRAVALWRQGSDFTTAALGAGYFDQSHFIHDFRRAAGRAPEAFFSARPA